MGKIEIKINNGKGKGVEVPTEDPIHGKTHLTHQHQQEDDPVKIKVKPSKHLPHLPTQQRQQHIRQSPIRVRESPVRYRAEGMPLQSTPKQYSIESTKALSKLDTLNAQYNSLAGKVNDIEKSTNIEKLDDIVTAKNTLAQIVGEIDKLQFLGLDAVQTCDLHSGKSEAKNQRKKLNLEIEALQQRAQKLHHYYEEIGGKIMETNTRPSRSESNSEECSVDTDEIADSVETYESVMEEQEEDLNIADGQGVPAPTEDLSGDMEVTSNDEPSSDDATDMENTTQETVVSMRKRHLYELSEKDKIIQQLREEIKAKDLRISQLMNAAHNRED